VLVLVEFVQDSRLLGLLPIVRREQAGRQSGSAQQLRPELLVVTLAERYRVPTVYGYRFMAQRGGLMSYGVDVDNLFERAATYVDRCWRRLLSWG
jgi:hypothetical protein